jgi:hypothetical protein
VAIVPDGTGESLVNWKTEQPTDLIGEYESLAVLREGHEAYWPHRFLRLLGAVKQPRYAEPYP